MDITPEMIAGVVVLTLLGLLLTGPGMWSERWGWGWLRGKHSPPGKKPDAARGADAPPSAGPRPPPR